MEIKFNVNSLGLSMETIPEIVDDSINFINASFEFNGAEWTKNTIVTAIFKSSDSAYSVLLKNGKCIVPTEVLREEAFKVGLCGNVTENGISKTFYTSEITVPTKASCFSYIFDNGSITPSQYDQIMSYLSTLDGELPPHGGGSNIVVNSVITELTSSEYNPIVLDELEDGIYSLNGYYCAYVGAEIKTLNNGLIQLTRTNYGYYSLVLDCEEVRLYSYDNEYGDNTFVEHIVNTNFFAQVANKIDREYGKGLSSNDFTDIQKSKLQNIEENAQENVIEKVKINGSEAEITEKAIDINIPSKISDLVNDEGYLKSGDFSKVATTGSYNDLIDTPDITDTVYDIVVVDEPSVSVADETEYRFIPYSASAEVSVGANITSIEIDKMTFYDMMGVPSGTTASYTFTYNGSNWVCDNVSSTNLSEYGITIVGTPVANDVIIIKLTGVLTSLSLTFGYDFNNRASAWMVFKSGETPCSIVYPSGIRWTGDSIADGEFVPEENKVYNIAFWHDGFYINAMVRGINEE